MKRAACVLAVRGDGAILAVSRPDPPLRFGFPGGGVDPGENFQQAAARELFEETGLMHVGELVPLYVTNTGRTQIAAFRAQGVIGRVRSSDEGWTRWVEPSVLACPGAAYPEFARELFRVAGIRYRCG